MKTIFKQFFFFSLAAFVLAAPVASFSENPAKSTSKSENTKKPQAIIVLDPGHGGKDEGAKVHSFQEKKLTLLTTLLTKKYLNEQGYKVILTRTRDAFLPLEKRVAFANRMKADVFVSIHFNSSSSNDAKGVEVFYYGSGKTPRSKASQNLAHTVLSRVVGSTDASSRGVKSGKFLVIRETEMPAILIEAGFMTNKDERLLLKDRAYIEKIAKGVADGVHNFIGS